MQDISSRRLDVYLSYTEGSNHVQHGSHLLVKADKYVDLGCHIVSSLEVEGGLSKYNQWDTGEA